ncbi:T9SS type A sorting domain-containing protein [Bacteroidales bacterium OttesenSCG-928-L03]|nr:T9SS type A sorting domain-containing protein [Bacteroidales bacterium OttesenSCG-928-L03]
MKRLLLPLLGIVFCAFTYAQAPYTICLKKNDGSSWPVSGYLSFSESTPFGYTSNTITLPAEDSENFADYEWFLIPAGEGEPMMFYIRQSNGKYLGTNNATNLSVFDEKEEDGFKFFIQRHNLTNSSRQRVKAYRIYLMYQNVVYFVSLSTSVGRLELKKKADSSSNAFHISSSPRFRNSIVYNGDMELVANYKPSTNFASSPPLTEEIELTAANTGGVAFFPCDYIDPGAINNIPRSYLIYSHASSGGEPEDGRYFLRMPTETGIEKPVDIPILSYAFDLQTTIKVRSTQAGIKAGEISFLDKQGNLISSQDIIPTKANSPEQEYHDPEAWEVHEFIFPVEVPEDVMTLRVSSSLEEGEFLDIDDIYMTVRERPHPYLYWNPASAGSTSWSDPANWVDEDSISGNVPTKQTQVVLPGGLSSYPYLPTPNTAKCSNIYLEPGASLGNQYFLDYDSAFIRFEFETMRWLALTAPLKNMYSGDYMFKQANPISEMRLYKTENPQTGLFYADWTTSFSTANYPLAPAMPFSFRVGHLFYHTIDEESGADDSSLELIERMDFSLPKTAHTFLVYDDESKLPTGDSYPIPEEGRKFAHRFIYEVEENGQSVVPQETVLVNFPTGIESGEDLVLIGNPLLSELSFNEFYRGNNILIYPEFKLLVGTEFVSGAGVDPDNNGRIESFVSVDGDVETGTIPPLTAFVVRTRETYSGQDLAVKKGMYLPVAVLNRAKAEVSQPNILVEVEQEGQTSRSLILISGEYSNTYSPGEDSRKLDVKEGSMTPLVYSVTDEQALEVNRIADVSRGVHLEVLTKKSGQGTLSLRCHNVPEQGTYLKDLQTGEERFFNGKPQLDIPFDAEAGESKAFYLGKRGTSIDPPSTPGIRLTTEGNRIRITSPEALSEVKVYNTSGLLLAEYFPSETHSFDIDKIGKNRLLIIKVQTETGTKTFKVGK